MSLDEKKNVMYSDGKGLIESQYSERDVKQFIKELLESPLKKVWQMKALIRNRAGEGLI